jgi:hypothetical protein
MHVTRKAHYAHGHGTEDISGRLESYPSGSVYTQVKISRCRGRSTLASFQKFMYLQHSPASGRHKVRCTRYEEMLDRVKMEKARSTHLLSWSYKSKHVLQ